LSRQQYRAALIEAAVCVGKPKERMRQKAEGISAEMALVREMRGKKAVVQIGTVPMTLLVEDLVKIREKEQTEPPKEAMHTP